MWDEQTIVAIRGTLQQTDKLKEFKKTLFSSTAHMDLKELSLDSVNIAIAGPTFLRSESEINEICSPTNTDNKRSIAYEMR
mmetsp:Transcript_4925/g.7236  ORF Transcript_4925/g.7236 Transcript_4925/m.7236 type:complete len:81 (-) Transcript_4925:266-508(-)